MKVALFFLQQVLFILALTVRSTHIRRLFFPPIAAINLYLGLSPLRTGLPFPADYLLACGQLSNLIIAADYLLIRDVHKDLNMKNQAAGAATLPFFSRLEWAVLLVSSPRHIGWAQEPSQALPSRWRQSQPTNSIKMFAFDQSVRLGLYVASFQVVGVYVEWFQRAGGKGPLTIFLPPLFRRPVGVLLGVVPIVTCLDGVHRLISLILVLARIWEPRDWVPLFGSWREAYTLRRFWGRTWHQMLRKFTSSHGSFMAQRVFSFDKNTYGYFLAQIFTAFFISAAIHITADFVFFGDGGSALCFFLSQALVVFIEDIIAQAIGTTTCWNLVHPTIRRSIGYLWVLIWFTLSVPLWHIAYVNI